MKRFSKIFSGIAAVMLGFGIILIAIGFSSAKADWEKIRGAEQGWEQTEWEFDRVDNIKIQIPFGCLEVAATEGDKIYFETAGVNAEALKIRQTDEKIDISMESEKNSLPSLIVLPLVLKSRMEDDENFTMQKYRLLLPENYSGKLEIDLDTGKVWIGGADAGEMDVSVHVGELVITKCSAGKLEAECSIGECSVDGIFRNISLENSIGVLDARIDGSHKDYNGVISCEIGELEYHMGTEEGGRYGSAGLGAWDRIGGISSRKTWESPAAKGKLKIECGVGRVMVVFCESDNPVLQEPVVEQTTDLLQYKDSMEQTGGQIQQEAIPEVSAAENDAYDIRKDVPGAETSREPDME